MADAYVRLPADSTGENPKYRDTIDGWHATSGNTVGNSPRYALHVYGTQIAIDELVAKSDVNKLTESKFVDILRSSANVANDATASDFTVG